tara:strand:- start:1025 stop:1276 length:252 start_codon:yes stop_codon:yes gene_type:complete
MTENIDVNEVYRTSLVDGLYERHQSKKHFLLAEIHKHLEYPESTNVEELDNAICELAKENQILFLLGNMFGGEKPTTKESDQE